MGTVVALDMTHQPIEGVVSRYLDHLRVRNLRPWTIYNRQRALARLATWANSPVLYLSEADLERWQLARSTQIQPEPRRTEMSNVRQFYRWASREGLLAVDPTARMDLPRVSRHLPRPIADVKLADAMAGADPETCAILGLAAFAGLRACEIARLDWSEVGLVDHVKQLRIIDGKGGHGRIVPLSAALADVLRMLQHRRGPVVPRLDGRAGQALPHRISQRANKYLHSMNITETLHQLRHRFATSAYQACRDIRAVQELLGHQSPNSTAIYAAAASEVARAAVESAGELHLPDAA